MGMAVGSFDRYVAKQDMRRNKSAEWSFILFLSSVGKFTFRALVYVCQALILAHHEAARVALCF
jgi:hypothetical protein